MCRQFITAGKLSKLRKIIEELYNEDLKIRLFEEIEKDEEDLEEEIEEELDEERKHKRDYEAILTHNVPVISYDAGEKFLTKMKWGIRFSPEKKSPLIFNSRDDTIAAKPFWKNTFNKNRILIPMFGFFEWQDIGQKKKLKTKITLVNRKMFLVPGLYHKNKEGINEFTLITTSPNIFMKKIHTRMPVILDDKNVFSYFTDSAEENLEKLKPVNAEMEMEELPTSEQLS
jgi:putative SOS response-associated peptidase YedK